MKTSQLIAILSKAQAERGDLDIVILDNDSDSLIDITRIGVTGDGRTALYASWQSPAAYGMIVDEIWTGVDDIDWPAPATGANITHAFVYEDGPATITARLLEPGETVEGVPLDWPVYQSRTAFKVWLNDKGEIIKMIPLELPEDEEE